MKTINHIQKRLIGLIISFLFLVSFVYSQVDLCQTQPGPNFVEAIPNGGGFDNPSGPYFIRIYVNVIRQSDGTGGQSEENVLEAIDILNQDYSPHQIFFQWDCMINYIDDSSLYNANFCGGGDFNQNPHDDGIDIYLFPDDANMNCGRAEGIVSTAFFVAGEYWNSPNIPLVRSHVISHEMGHCLGLWHTFQNQANCVSLVNNSNCQSCGDFVCDTPVDPFLAFNVDYPDCQWNGSGTDPNGDPYDPDELNVMAYTNVSCMDYFTTGQGERIRQLISFSPVLQACLIQPDHYYLDIASSTSWTTSNTPNNGDILIEDELVIESGATLTVEAGVKVRFGDEGRLVIQQNAKLILNGTLTGRGCGLKWKGVEVWGKSDESQYSQGGVTAQGRLVGRLGSLIENAETGVKLYGPSYTNHAGGQISCSGTTFRNNTIAVKFAPYKNFWPHSWPADWQGQPRSYFGYFTSCTFENNNDYPHSLALGFNSFLHLTGVNGVRVSGSHFTNTQSIANCSSVADYGYGIFATDAGFRVQAKCTNSTYPCNNYVHSTFNGLGYGIHTSTAINNRPYTIRQTDFSNCYVGIKNNAVSNGTLLFNDFYLGNVPDACVNSGEQLGVFFETGISGFTMQENDFIGQGGNVNTTVGSLCKNMGQFNNVIRRNYYSNLNYANLAEGENATGAFSDNDRGLYYLCNQNSSVNQADFAVVDGPSVDRIRTGQGLEDNSGGLIIYNAAGNRFSYGFGFDINNEGEGIDYYYNPSAPNQTPLNYAGLIDIFEAPNNTCPEDYCEPPCMTQSEIGAEKEKYYDDRTNEQTAKTEKEAADAAGDAELAIQKSKEADYYRQKMDKEAFMVVLHLMHDTMMFHPDTLTVWLENLDVFGVDMIWAMSQQAEGNSAIAQQFVQRAAQRPDVSQQQKKDLYDMKVLLKTIDRKSPYGLDKDDLRKLEQLTKRDLSLTAQLARNILTLHGHKFEPKYRLPGVRERSDDLKISEQQQSANQQLTIYPNPNSGSFSIEWQPENKDLQTATLTITDISGKVITVQTVNAFTQNRIDLRGQAHGVYFYQLQNEGDKPLIGKFILQ